MPPLTEGGGGRHGLAGSKTAVTLRERDRERPWRLARMRTAQAQAAARARIPPLRDSDETPVPVAEKVGRTSEGVCLCVAKYLEIDDAGRALVVDLACQRPADLSYAAEPGASNLTWTHARKTAEAAGQPRLATLSCGAARDILADAQTEPHRMVHCRERRNPDLEAKARNVPPPPTCGPRPDERVMLAALVAPAAGSHASLTRGAYTLRDGARRGREDLSAGLAASPSHAVVVDTAPPDTHAPAAWAGVPSVAVKERDLPLGREGRAAVLAHAPVAWHDRPLGRRHGPVCLTTRATWRSSHRNSYRDSRRNSVHKCPKTAPRGHFSRFVYTIAFPRLSTTAQQCTQTPQNGSKRPFSPICVHSCVVALAVTPTPPGR